jgi:outer membrane protein assembly factor BamB
MRVGALSLALVASAFGCSEPPIEKVWQYPSYAASGSSPGVSDDLIVFGTASGELHAVSKSGGALWKFGARKEIISAPQVFDGLVLFGSTNHNFYALDTKGREVWKFTTFDRIKGDPLVAGNTVYFGSYDDHLYALDVTTKEQRWVFPPMDTTDAGKLAIAKADAATKALWPKNDFSYSQPTLTSNGLIVSGNLDGYLYGIDQTTGELKWRWGDEHTVKAKASITSTVLELNETLYFGGNDGKVYAIALNDQSVKWSFETGDEVNSSPVIDENGVLYIGSRDKKLYALDAKTGALKWAFEAQGPILGKPALYKNLVLFGGGEGDGTIYAVDAESGKLFWQYKTEGRIDADCVVDGDRFYVASADRNLYAFEIRETTK